MSKPITVTFDKNVYEFITDPQKPAPVDSQERSKFEELHNMVVNHTITPLISESILTYETLSKPERITVLSNTEPIVISSDGSRVTISSNPTLHPGNTAQDDFYLAKAIALGFKILPGKRFGKLVNPAIKTEWYYYTEEDYLEIAERFSSIVKVIEETGAGYRFYQEVTGALHNPGLPVFENIRRFKGPIKKLSSAISEWSDGDSVALHLAYNVDFFCTNDQGKSAGEKSVLSRANSRRLYELFGFTKVTPSELLEVLKIRAGARC